MAELQRASVFAIREETTIGELIAPSAASQFIPLRPGFEQSSEVETLENDELVDDIGAGKGLVGLETPEGTHPAYLKHSGTEGTAPETSLMYKSALGEQYNNTTEYATIAGSTAGTSTARAVIKVGTGIGANFRVGQALLIKDGANGYAIRNVREIVGDDLHLNFNLAAAPAAGVNLGKAIHFVPKATDHPSFSAWLYGANGGYIQAISGCRTNNISISLPAGEQAEVEFGYSGVETFWNPVQITASTRFIDFVDSGGTKVVELDQKFFKSPVAFAEHVQVKMDAASVDTITVTYDSATGKYTLSSSASPFSLLWNTGANTANSAATKLGFTTASDSTGSTSYTSPNAMVLTAPFTPVYDQASNIVVKGAQLFVGDFYNNVCRDASEVSIEIGLDQEIIESLCKTSGVLERLNVARTVSMEATLILKRHEAHLFDKFINNKDTEVMVNAGGRDSSGNWIPGQVFNFYMPQATITQHVTGGDTVVELTLTAQGYISTGRKDVYLNFI
ncbi:MAG: hypothetical protein QW818_02440 [Candidatus Aenigmatarchaeota archaeon]